MKLFQSLTAIILLAMIVFGIPISVAAQEGEPASPLSVSTLYPSQVIGIGETVTLPLKISSPSEQTILLDIREAPSGWNVTFHGGGRIVQSAFVEPSAPTELDVRFEPPADVAPGPYQFVVLARGTGTAVEFPIELIVEEKVPASLAFETDLPTVRGAPDTTFRFGVDLKNDGDEEVTVNLQAEAPEGFLVTFRSGGQEVTSLPIGAGESKRVDIQAEPITELAAGQYPINVHAQGEDIEANLALTAEVVGKSSLSISGPGGRLSENIDLGRDNPIKLIIQNTGSAPAIGVELSSTSPSGWKVEFEPKEIPEIPANSEMEVTATIRPAEKAIAGDYAINFTARPRESTSESVEFRVTARTSTMWGIVGVALIAVAVGVVALAVMRFGRR